MQLLDLCNDGRFQEVDLLLRSKEKGAAVNATFEEVHVSDIRLTLQACTIGVSTVNTQKPSVSTYTLIFYIRREISIDSCV